MPRSVLKNESQPFKYICHNEKEKEKRGVASWIFGPLLIQWYNSIVVYNSVI